MEISTVTVIGANGEMGRNISAIFASFGNAKVYMVSRSIDKSRIAAEKASKSVKADSIIKNLIPADYSMLADCIQKSDLVFESVAENLQIKKDINKKIVSALKGNTIVCSGTSGLSLNELSKVFPNEFCKNYIGMHFFNPPYSMTLCEVIPTEYTDKNLLKDIKEYLSKTLFRTVVQVKDSPAFLGNRIGFQFINEALQYAERYKCSGGIDYIDSILGAFSGRSMSPLVTSDFVGLDVHKAIVDNINENTNDFLHDTFILPKYVNDLIDNGQLGRKVNCGLYKTVAFDNSKKKRMVYDIETGEYREKIDYKFIFVENIISNLKIGNYKEAFSVLISNRSVEAEICLGFLLRYIVYSLKLANDIGDTIHAADDVMARGFNWCPPLAMVQAINDITDFNVLVKERLDKKIQKKIDIDKVLCSIEPSKYDYRLFFKASK